MRSIFTGAPLLIFLCALIMALVSPSLGATKGDIFWLCPSDPVSRKIPAANYMGLFDEGRRWTEARSRIRVFKIYPDVASRAPAGDLRRIFRYLDRHHIALALEWGVLTATSECGGGVEGYAGRDDAFRVAQRIKNLGGDLHYLAMDEPLFFGHYFTGRRACRAGIHVLAQNAAQNIRRIKAVFPHVQIGDIEPIRARPMPPDWAATVRDWLSAYQAAARAPLAFYHADVQDWDDLRNLKRLDAMLASLHIPMGVIVNGNGDANSDKEWMAQARRNARLLWLSGLHPRQVIFQSWSEHPKNLVPDSDPDAMTSLVNFYFSQG